VIRGSLVARPGSGRVGRAEARLWSFYILSSGGGDKLAGIGLKTEFCE